MKPLRTLLLAALFLPLTAFAQEAPADRPDIEELFTVMRLEKTTNESLKAVEEMISGNFEQQFAARAGTSPEAQAQRAAIQKKIFDFITSEINWAQLKAPMAKIYAETLTPEETKGVIEFFKSPAGQAFLDKQPILMKKAMEVTQTRMMEVMPKLQTLIQQELQASQSPTPSAEASPAPKASATPQ
ncbi:MAG TPA: DUF2059 domain-containing protein [Chthoniobacteraceae bacterium]|nr:DUF2059 domain-containing protein [Chthoniobacteraceae bacterium]